MRNKTDSKLSLTAAYIESISPTLELVIEQLEEIGPIDNIRTLHRIEQVIDILEGIEAALKAIQ